MTGPNGTPGAPGAAGQQVVVYADPDTLVADTAALLVDRLAEAQAGGGPGRVVLTGGGTGIALLERVRGLADRDPGRVDWGRVEFYWGDERFLPPGHPDRNETQARDALLDHLPVDPDKIFAMGADTGTGPSGADAAAQEYARQLATAAGEDGGVPAFDVLLLGMGPEGHTASVFPHSPAVHETDRTVVDVHGCPKPPPTRVSLTLPAIRRATEVWMLTTGSGKATAVARALGGTAEVDLPAAGATGRAHTRWFLDREAAAELPAG